MSIAFIPARYFRILMALLQEKGLNTAPLFELAQLPESFSAPQQEDYLSLPQVETIVTWALEHTGDRALGLQLGQRLNLSAHGVAGYAGLCAPTLGAALRVAQRFQPLVMPLTDLMVIEQPEVSHLCIRPSQPMSATTTQFILDATAASIYAQGRFLYPEPWREVCAHIPYSKEQYEPAAMEVFHDVAMRFDCDDLRLIIPTALLAYPLALANEQSFHQAVRQCEALLSTMPRPGGMAEALRHSLLQAGPPLPSLTELAQQRHVSERTLRRQLTQEGVKWRDLLTEVKMSLAKQALANSHDSITDIALRLGYQDSANFARAFRHYTGLSPSQWRHA